MTCPGKNHSSPGTLICPVFWLGVLNCPSLQPYAYANISSDFTCIYENIALPQTRLEERTMLPQNPNSATDGSRLHTTIRPRLRCPNYGHFSCIAHDSHCDIQPSAWAAHSWTNVTSAFHHEMMKWVPAFMLGNNKWQLWIWMAAPTGELTAKSAATWHHVCITLPQEAWEVLQSACLSVCLSDSHISKTTRPNFTKFYTLPVARSSSMQYAMYFQLWITHVFTRWSEWARTKDDMFRPVQQVAALEAKSAVSDCIVFIFAIARPSWQHYKHGHEYYYHHHNLLLLLSLSLSFIIIIFCHICCPSVHHFSLYTILHMLTVINQM